MRSLGGGLVGPSHLPPCGIVVTEAAVTVTADAVTAVTVTADVHEDHGAEEAGVEHR